MIKFLKAAVIILTLSFCLNPLFSQLQTNVKDQIVSRFIKYTESVQREEIYIHTDREYYIAGEEIWFNVYLVYRQGNKPALKDKLTYVEILNQYNRPVAQKCILMDNGFGPGQIVVPDSLSSGTYTIRAYTNRMKNFLPENCFMKDIKIFNAITKKGFIGKKYSENIPEKQSENGLLISVKNINSDSLEIIVNDIERSLSENNSNNTIYFFIHTNGIINLVTEKKILYGSTRIAISKKMLMAGINHITVFDLKGKPMCERFIFTPFAEKAVLAVHSSSGMKTREKITVGIDIGNETDLKPYKANLSISITPCSESLTFPGLSDYLVFGSEFGIQPFKVFKGRRIDEIPVDEIDSMLLTLKSNWIDWEKILSEESDQLIYKPETEEHFLTGKLLKRNSESRDSGSYVFMSTPGKVPVFQYARTDREGNFRFNIRIDDKVKDLVIQPALMDINSRIKIESPFSDNYLTNVTFIDSIYKELPEFVSESGVNYQVGRIYGSSSLGLPVVEPISPEISKRFYGKPDTEIKMADYIKLPVMEEVFFELLKGTFLKRKNEGYELYVSDPVDDNVYKFPPVTLVDGVIVNSPDIIAGLDPEIVESIDLVRDKYYIGDYLFYGIINVITSAGDFSSVKLPDYATRFNYKVVDQVFSFPSPDYSTPENKNSRVPDFRNTLYWNPAVKPDTDGKAFIDFWSSDKTSDYEINIQGITSEGELISIRKIININQTF